jgi:hypothetical protein
MFNFVPYFAAIANCSLPKATPIKLCVVLNTFLKLTVAPSSVGAIDFLVL